MINTDDLEELERLGFGADVNALEQYVATLQEAAAENKRLVVDAIYDRHFQLLKKLKPESEIVNRNWESEDEDLDEHDVILQKFGMCSINTITSYNELAYFVQMLNSLGTKVDIMASIKEDGHGVRCVYVYGKLFSGSTRGRYKKGRDITRHFKLILKDYVEEWKDIPEVEIRGEMLVSKSNFENHLKHKLKTPLSSVTSLIKDSATDEEIKLLDFVAYKVVASDNSLQFNTLWEEFDYLSKVGFKVPENALFKGVTGNNLITVCGKLLGYFENLMDNDKIAYACDGIVLAINDNKIFYSLGKNRNTWKANFALKMGKYWESNKYESTILDIIWTPGKKYLTPKAVIDPVKTVNGTEVKVVPLYNVGVMERYGYTKGRTIFFRYGGETGVTCCDYEGKSIQVNRS